MFVRPCPSCRLLMWIKEEAIEYPDENTMKVTCPHCQHIARFKMVVEGPNAGAPKMGH